MRDQDYNIQTTLMAIHVLSLNLGLRTEGCRQPDGFYREKSGYGKDRIFRSQRPPLKLPKDKNSNIVSFMFRDSTIEKLSFRDFKDKVSMVGNGLISWVLEKEMWYSCFLPILFMFLSVSLESFQLGRWQPL